jgi:hypothetical protein
MRNLTDFTTLPKLYLSTLPSLRRGAGGEVKLRILHLALKGRLLCASNINLLLLLGMIVALKSPRFVMPFFVTS